jgi:lipopolysaccharide export system protein LptA
MPSNTVTLTGNVMVTQGNNILKGDKLVVDLTTQKSRVESSNSGGRVQGVFGPSKSTQ